MSKDYLYSNQLTIFGKRDIVGFGDKNFYVKEIGKNIADEIIISNHYSKKICNGSFIHLGIYRNGIVGGVLQFGPALNPASCGSVVAGTAQNQYLELNRMWVSDELTDYPESRAISCAIKYIRGKYPKIKWIQSFADERCGGLGVVYQACSFCYYGEHLSVFWELDGVVYHNIIMTVKEGGRGHFSATKRFLQRNKDRATKMELRQFRYIKFLDQSWRKKCLLKEQPYPKRLHAPQPNSIK
jgi:adenine modification enzyme